MSERPDTERLAYITCPTCKRGIGHPFPRTGMPQAYTHYNPRGPDCRLVVIAYSHHSEHMVYEVPKDQSLEQALVERMQEAA